MRKLALAACFAISTTAAAEPTQKELDARAAELKTKLDGQGFTIMVEAPFVVVGDGSAAQVKHIATGFLRDKVHMLEKDYFTKRPAKLIEVWLFTNEKSFRKGAKKYFNDTPDTPYGYYSPTANAMIMNVAGLGTLSHELVHPYMEANFPEVPGGHATVARPAARHHARRVLRGRLGRVRAGALPHVLPAREG
jgi:hypothetical protein